MLHILGMVLKIAGILLGSILGMILLISLLILFVPIRYRAEGTYEGKPEADVRLSWLLSILYLRVRYGEAGIALRIRIFGIPLGGRKKSAGKQERKKRKKQKSKEEGDSVSEQKPEKENEEAKQRADYREEPEEDKTPAKEDVPEGGTAPCGNERPEEKTAPGREERPEGELSEDRQKASLRDRIRGIRDKITYTFHNICDKIKNIRKKTQELKAFVRDEKNKEAFRLIIRQLKYLWKHIRPRKLSVSCHFGFDDPSVTGQALAAASVLYPLYRDNLRLYPDFEQKTLAGEVFLKGRIRMFPMLLIIIRLWRNRQIRGYVRKFMK